MNSSKGLLEAYLSTFTSFHCRHTHNKESLNSSIRTVLLVVQANVRAKIDNFVTFLVYFDNSKVDFEQNLT